MTAPLAAYTVTFPRASMGTLEWLAARGYDGNFLALATPVDDENGTYVRFTLSESEAWVFSTNAESDKGAFLSCCADAPLADALLGLLGRIV